MVLETVDLDSYAVLWAATGIGNDGRITVSSSPIEIPVRWIDAIQESTNPLISLQEIESVADVDRDIAIGSILWHGRLANLPTPLADLRVVRFLEKIPDLKHRNIRRSVALAKYNDTLPTA